MNDGLASTALAIALAPAADRYNTDPATDVFDTKFYKGLRFEIHEGAGTTGTAVVTAESCDQADAGGTNTAIPFRYRVDSGEWQDATASGFTTPAGGGQIIEVDVRAEDLPDGGRFCRLQLTEGVDAPTVAGVTCRAYGARYAEETPQSPVA